MPSIRASGHLSLTIASVLSTAARGAMALRVAKGAEMKRGMALSRRRLLAFAGAALVSAAAKPVIAAPSILYFRRLALYNVNTGESYNSVFWANDYYIPQGLKSLNWALRDFHTNTTHPIDPRLLDLLAALQEKLGTDEPFLLTSGYRTPQPNAPLVAEGAAVNS